MSRTKITNEYEIAIDHSLGECMGYESGAWLYKVNAHGSAISESVPVILDNDKLKAFWSVVSWDGFCDDRPNSKKYSSDTIDKLPEDVRQKIRDELKVDLIRRRILTTSSDKSD